MEAINGFGLATSTEIGIAGGTPKPTWAMTPKELSDEARARDARYKAEREEGQKRHAEADARGVPREAPCECCGDVSPRRIFGEGSVSYTCNPCYMGDCPACEEDES